MTSYRLAIIEDDELLRANYADALIAQGYVVESYADREAATAIFQSRLPDLVVSILVWVTILMVVLPCVSGCVKNRGRCRSFFSVLVTVISTLLADCGWERMII